MSIFLIKHDTRYPYLGLLNERDGYKMPSFYGQPISDLWNNPTVTLTTEDFMETNGEFPYLFSRGILVCSKKAWGFLELLIANSIEVFQLECQEGEFYALNVLAVIDCLDHEHSHIERFENGDIKSIVKKVFKAGCSSNKHIFKIPERLLTDIYVSDIFKTVVEANELNRAIAYSG